MCNYLDAEVGVQAGGDDHLAIAALEMVGVLEHREPGSITPDDWCCLIDYEYEELK
jgi:hypothetical protein